MPLLIQQVALSCYAVAAERRDCQASALPTHSEVIRVRDRPNIPKPRTVSPAALNAALISTMLARQGSTEAIAGLRGDDEAAHEHERELRDLPKTLVSVVRT